MSLANSYAKTIMTIIFKILSIIIQKCILVLLIINCRYSNLLRPLPNHLCFKIIVKIPKGEIAPPLLHTPQNMTHSTYIYLFYDRRYPIFFVGLEKKKKKRHAIENKFSFSYYVTLIPTPIWSKLSFSRVYIFQ